MGFLEKKKQQTRLFTLFLNGNLIALFNRDIRGSGSRARDTLTISYAENNGVIYRDTFVCSGGVHGFAGHCYDVVNSCDIEKTRERLGEHEVIKK